MYDVVFFGVEIALIYIKSIDLGFIRKFESSDKNKKWFSVLFRKNTDGTRTRIRQRITIRIHTVRISKNFINFFNNIPNIPISTELNINFIINYFLNKRFLA